MRSRDVGKLYTVVVWKIGIVRAISGDGVRISRMPKRVNPPSFVQSRISGIRVQCRIALSFCHRGDIDDSLLPSESTKA